MTIIKPIKFIIFLTFIFVICFNKHSHAQLQEYQSGTDSHPEKQILSAENKETKTKARPETKSKKQAPNTADSLINTINKQLFIAPKKSGIALSIGKPQHMDKNWICLDISIENHLPDILSQSSLRLSPAAANSSYSFDNLIIKGAAGEQKQFYTEKGIEIQPGKTTQKRICINTTNKLPIEKTIVFVFLEGKIKNEYFLIRQMTGLGSN